MSLYLGGIGTQHCDHCVCSLVSRLIVRLRSAANVSGHVTGHVSPATARSYSFIFPLSFLLVCVQS
jgi:hypothetical protein